MKLKTLKTLSKRVKVTKNGTVLARRSGQDHFNSRQTGNQTRRKRRDISLSKREQRALKAGLPYENV